MRKTLARRPAESLTGAGALTVLIVYGFGIDDPQVPVALTVVLGLLPAAVTWIVSTARSGRGR